MDLSSILAKNELIAGVEVTDLVVRLALAKRNKAKTQIDLAIEQPLEPGVVSGGQIVKKEDFLAALKKLRQRCPKKIEGVIATISPLHTYGKIYSFPNNIYGDKLQETVQLTIDYQLPMPAKDIYAGWQEIETGEHVKVFVACAPRSMIDGYIEVFNKAGFALLAVERYPLSLIRALPHEFAADPQGIVIKMQQPEAVYIFAYMNGYAFLSRVLPLERATAEFIDVELKNILNFIESEYKLRPKVYDFKDLKLDSSIVFTGDSSSWLVAFGAAMRALVPRAQDRIVSFLPASTNQIFQYRKAINFSKIAATVMSAAAIFFILAYAGTWFFMSSLASKADNHIQALNTPLPPEDAQIQNQMVHLNSVVSTTSQILLARPQWSKVIVELNSRVTPGIIITNADFTGPSLPLSITGVAQSRTVLNNFKNSLQQSQMFTAIQLPLNNLDQLANIPFSITFSLKDPNSIYPK